MSQVTNPSIWSIETNNGINFSEKIPRFAISFRFDKKRKIVVDTAIIAALSELKARIAVMNVKNFYYIKRCHLLFVESYHALLNNIA